MYGRVDTEARFFLGSFFLPVVAEIMGFHDSEIPAKYRTRWFKRIFKFKKWFLSEIFEKS
jgi:hypothetical protein